MSPKMSRGSTWLRWDPHIHVPGTLLNDQYKGSAPWPDFEACIAASDPPISALGVTDYFTIASYELALARKRQNPSAWPDLLFPNIEMRLGVEAAKTTPINVHLLCSPDDEDHVEQIKRFLNHLTFRDGVETYRCNDADLARLGQTHSISATDAAAARKVGANQFKITFDNLLEAFDGSKWAKRNILVAVAGGSRDGTSSLKEDGSFAATRVAIERRADVIFSAQQRQREFWLGQGAATVEQLKEKWGGCKPCLHGSDAHDLDHVGEPDLARNCWVKGAASFESLHQACIEPEARVFIGPVPPKGALASQTITSMSVSEASWLATPRLDLNPGLVAIIGARGSGKTALADLIAAGAYSASPQTNQRSFLHRARDYLHSAEVALEWGSEDIIRAAVAHLDFAELLDSPRVRYLSQQFVEQLCSSEGVTDELAHEIERVIFSAFPVQERLGAMSFQELLEARCEQAQRSRGRHEQAILDAYEVIAAERQKQAALPQLKIRHERLTTGITKDKAERLALMGKEAGSSAQRLEEMAAALETARSRVDAAKRKQRALRMLRDEVKELRTRSAPSRLRKLKTDYTEAGLTEQQWDEFDLDFKGDVDAVLAEAIAATDKLVHALQGPAESEPAFVSGAQDAQRAFIPEGVDLAKQTLSLLEKEYARLHALAGIDAQNVKQVARLSEKIARDEALLTRCQEATDDGEGAAARIEEALADRDGAYRGVFDAIVNEQRELSEIYAPLARRLTGESGALAKLGFAVVRVVNVAMWAAAGEELLDLRRDGPFRGKGALLKAAQDLLGDAWRTGSAADVEAAIAAFRAAHERTLVHHMPNDMRDAEQRRAWGGSIARWLYDTSHVSLAYKIQYDGVDIEQLSPGTRGIVLLLLFLAIDADDERPLIIDQPEENLDPKSVHDELVGRFRTASLKRQIIIVTHNANLVVNTDADQIIVAECGSHRQGQLPEIRYTSGGLEDPKIRRMVCEILEGGEAAFKERAKRLRVTMS